jgi:hypothetical protein
LLHSFHPAVTFNRRTFSAPLATSLSEDGIALPLLLLQLFSFKIRIRTLEAIRNFDPLQPQNANTPACQLKASRRTPALNPDENHTEIIFRIAPRSPHGKSGCHSEGHSSPECCANGQCHFGEPENLCRRAVGKYFPLETQRKSLSEFDLRALCPLRGE